MGAAQGAPLASDGALGELAELVEAATVRIHRADAGYIARGPEGFLGSGFFVAPSWVLTCAHVAVQGEVRQVTVVYSDTDSGQETPVAGTVVAALPHASADAPPHTGSWPTPDLAMIRLDRPVDHPCVYVTERPASYFRNSEMVFASWAEKDRKMVRYSGFCVAGGSIDDEIRLSGDRLTPGMSGGPVVDPARGEVVAVIKSQSMGDPGGTAVGVEQLRTLPVPEGRASAETDDDYQAVFHAHDRYHWARHINQVNAGATWTDVQSRLGEGAGRLLSPQQRAELFGRLAALPPPVSTYALLDLLHRLPGLRYNGRKPVPRSWRDGFGVLYDRRRGDERDLELVLQYCMSVVVAERPYVTPGTSEAEERLWEWVMRIAHERLERGIRVEFSNLWTDSRARTDREQRRAAPAFGEPHPAGERASVLLDLQPGSWQRDSYVWWIGVARPGGEIDPVAADDRGTPFRELQTRLAGPLSEAFRACDEPEEPAVLQVVLPKAVLGLDVERWRTAPDGPPIGVVRPVIVRCSNVELPAPGKGGYDARWHHIGTTGMRARVLDCQAGRRVSVPGEAALGALSHETVPVLCHFAERPDAEAQNGFERVVESGYRVVLLHRRDAVQRADTVCGDLHWRAEEAIAGAGSAERLPRMLHELRKGVSHSRTETYWSDWVTLFYEDPGLPLPGSGEPLNAP